ncbi:MAG: DUF2784 domain-containing protein [Methylobacter sp.]|jgi:hypothetical protein|uniref:DUF2784 domain-containing protein n=1 Tax=Methylobacter sp. TaxID=2051955 RepID=UPI0025FCB788|nr:DUF2784 domain-containing protein [Methylobacter sp.]MCK9620447.1 DUF2784 domain-containing protein [Methylobacter sp.]
MIYRFLADSVLIVHLLFIGFVVFGGLFALRFRWVALVHIPAACWGAYIELAGGLCPLTTIEVGFRRMAGDAGYSGSFIDHYLLPIIYPAGLTRDIQLWLAGLVILVNVAIYSRLIYRLRLSRPT